MIAIIFSSVFPELKKDARSVVDYKEYPLEYYNVSLQPSGWYQWFDSQYEDKASWEQVCCIYLVIMLCICK